VKQHNPKDVPEGGLARPGPRFARREGEPRIRAVVRRLLEEGGAAGLSFRKVASDPELKLSYGAPLHYYGTNAGMIGAVASDVFRELASGLRLQRLAAPPTLNTLVALARCLAVFAIGRQRLYQAAHSRELWNAVLAAGELDQAESPGGNAKDRSIPWLKGVADSRDQAFEEFVIAARDALAQAPAHSPASHEDLARMVTALVDGYLFQLWNELAEPEQSPVEDITRLVQLALLGLERQVEEP